MSDASRRHVARRFPRMKPWRKFLLLGAVCGFVGYVTVSVALRRDTMAQKANSSGAFPLAQDIRKQDSNFLDDLVQKQNRDDHHGNPLSAPEQNLNQAGTIASSSKPVPRAELVVNTEIVKRGELIIHKGTAKVKRQTITP
jgi:hypothetical protein